MSEDYHFEKLDIGVTRLPPNVKGICPECGNSLTYIHDLRCDKCDNQLVQYCVTCDEHYRLADNNVD